MTAQEAPSPNVLIILTDDQRGGTVTPQAMPSTAEWFGVGGTKYSNAYANTPLCCPSRASLFTGQYTHNHRVLANDQPENMDQDTTVQAALQKAGYLTGFTGKNMNGWPFDRRPPHFDRWSMVEKGYHDPRVNRNGTVVQEHGYGTEVIRREALSILDWFDKKDSHAPWLLFVQNLRPSRSLRGRAGAPGRGGGILGWEPRGEGEEPERQTPLRPAQSQARHPQGGPTAPEAPASDADDG